MIERVPDCGYIRLYREVIYQTVEDYFKLSKVNPNTELHNHYLESERMIFGTCQWSKCFEFLCDCAGLDAGWVRRRVMREKLKDINWKSTPNIGKKVLGLCSFTDITPNYRRKMVRRLKLKLVKG